MALYKIFGKKLTPVRETGFDSQFKKEKELQNFTENNLQELFVLEFISSEFNIESFWLDSLAFDPSINSFVIIEYKKVENFSLMDQGQTYLNLVLEHKADVLLEYNNKVGKNLGKNDIDWSQTRVIFIGPKFNTYQKRALSPNLPFELWEVELYDGGIIEYDQINPVGFSKKTDKKTNTFLGGTAAKEIVTYTVENHLSKANPISQKIFEDIRKQIFELDPNIQEKPVKNYVGYKLSWYNFVTIHVYKDKLKIHVRKDKLEKDINKRLSKIPSSYGWGLTPLWWMDVFNEKDMEYILPIIKESYDSAPDR